jgi:membrane protein DedA with SNARE-associated domain
MAAVRKFGKYFFITPEKIERARDAIMKRPSMLIGFTVLRFIPLIPNSLVTAAAGFVRLPLVPFLITTSIGIFVRALYLGIAGWLTARAYGTMTGANSAIATLGVVVASAAAVSFITMGVVLYVNRRKQKSK